MNWDLKSRLEFIVLCSSSFFKFGFSHEIQVSFGKYFVRKWNWSSENRDVSNENLNVNAIGFRQKMKNLMIVIFILIVVFNNINLGQCQFNFINDDQFKITDNTFSAPYSDRVLSPKFHENHRPLNSQLSKVVQHLSKYK